MAVLWLTFVGLCVPLANLSAPAFEVRWVGEMRKVMREGDLRASIDLRALAKKKHLYALGPLENLRGEVTIWDSKPSIATIRKGRIHMDTSWDHSACFLVYVQVDNWVEMPIPAEVKDEKQLEQFITLAAGQQRIDVHRPFPFLVKARPKELNFHVMNRIGDGAHTPELHDRVKVRFTVRNQPVNMLGFYSDKHHGVFTHHGSNSHLHMITEDATHSGHVDSVIIGDGAVLLLPKS